MKVTKFVTSLLFLGCLKGFCQDVLFSEDFEGLTLGPSVDEGVAAEMVWTNQPPANWSIDNSQLFGADEEGVGVTEWKGWAFADKDWWVETAGDQRRSEFAGGQNTVLIADPDEWDDIGSPGGQEPGGYNTFLSTPSIDVSGIVAGSAVMSFDSSWRPEFDDNYNQSGNLRVAFDGGEPIEIFEWLSDSSSPNHKDEAINERVTFPLNNPEGATEMVITFGMYDAGNDWWWALDNIEVVAVSAMSILFSEDFEGLTLGASVDEGVAAEMVWTNQPPANWMIDNSQLFGADEEGVGVTEWKGWAFADKDWWVETAGDQRRSEFVGGQNTVLIADPDEWDDIGSPGGQEPGDTIPS